MNTPFVVQVNGRTVFSGKARVDFVDPDDEDPDRSPIPVAFSLKNEHLAIDDDHPAGILFDAAARERPGQKIGTLTLHFGIEEKFQVIRRTAADGRIYLSVVMDGKEYDLDRSPVNFLVTDRQWDTLSILKELDT